MTLMGRSGSALLFHARLRSPFSSSCCLTFAAGSSEDAHEPEHLFFVRHVHASWLPSMMSVGKGHSLICGTCSKVRLWVLVLESQCHTNDTISTFLRA